MRQIQVITILFLLVLSTYSCEMFISDKEIESKETIEQKWLLYKYNVFFKKDKILVVNGENMIETIDTIPICALSLNFVNSYDKKEKKETIVTYFVEKDDLKFSHNYYHSIGYHNKKPLVLYRADGGEIVINPKVDSLSNSTFHDYLNNNNETLHPWLKREAQKRGVLE